MCGKSVFSVSFILLTAVVLMGLANAAEPGLVGWWRFDEGSGTTAYDSAGSNDGTISGATWTTGQIGGALSFGGDGDYVETTTISDIHEPITISAWVKTSGSASQQTIFGRNKYTSAYYYENFLFIGVDNKIAFGDRPGSGSPYVYSTYAIELEQWYHIAVTRASASDIKLYINGVLNNSGSTTPCINTGIKYRVGTINTSHFPFNGKIEDFRIYDRVLSAGEIWQLYQGLLDKKASNPNPINEAVDVDPNKELTWKSGYGAISHDVYFGTDFNDVNDAVSGFFIGDADKNSQVNWYDILILTEQWLGEPCGLGLSADLDGDGDVNLIDFAIMANDWEKLCAYKGNQESNCYDPCGLVLGGSYYWRVDEVNEYDVNSPWKGSIWSFVVVPMNAHNPSPADETNAVVEPDVTLTLSWLPGFNANSHDVYIGTDYNEVNAADTLTLGVYKGNQEANSYGPFSPELYTTYYWRIDEVSGLNISKGKVWSFTAWPGVNLGVMSFNIKGDEGVPSSDPDAWICTSGTDRRDRVFAMILSESTAFGPNGPDIVGLQEALNNQVIDLKGALSNYDFYGVGRADGATQGEYAGIFYRSNRFSRTNQGTFWLSYTPDVPSKYPGANWRIASWVILHDNMTDQSYFVLNTHWDNKVQAARLYSAGLIRLRIKSLSGGLPLIVTGDLNCHEDSAEFLELIGQNDPTGFQLLDSYREVHPGGPDSRIDYVLYSAYFEAIGATIERAQIYGRYPSDHYPVTGTLRNTVGSAGQ